MEAFWIKGYSKHSDVISADCVFQVDSNACYSNTQEAKAEKFRV